MGAGIPVMTADDGLLGFDEAPDPITQVVANDPDSWHQCIAALCSAPGDAAAMARRAQAWVRQTHGPEHQIRSLLQTLSRICHGSAMPFQSDT